MKLRARSAFLTAGLFALACAASPEPQPMRPAAGSVPDVEREVDVQVRHGDRVTVIDDALVIQDANGRRFLMLFDGDVACEDTVEATGVPRGLILQAEIDADGRPMSWTFYRNGTVRPLSIGSAQANYRTGPGGGSLAVRTTLDQLPLEIRGSYQPEYCR